MAKKTVLNEPYQGLLVAMNIPAEVREQDGNRFASFGSAVPIHRCTKEQVTITTAPSRSSWLLFCGYGLDDVVSLSLFYFALHLSIDLPIFLAT